MSCADHILCSQRTGFIRCKNLQSIMPVRKSLLESGHLGPFSISISNYALRLRSQPIIPGPAIASADPKPISVEASGTAAGDVPVNEILSMKIFLPYSEMPISPICTPVFPASSEKSTVSVSQWAIAG